MEWKATLKSYLKVYDLWDHTEIEHSAIHDGGLHGASAALAWFIMWWIILQSIVPNLSPPLIRFPFYVGYMRSFTRDTRSYCLAAICDILLVV